MNDDTEALRLGIRELGGEVDAAGDREEVEEEWEDEECSSERPPFEM